jgi:pimeloyl-ACP methyl ester carboxylesterase
MPSATSVSRISRDADMPLGGGLDRGSPSNPKAVGNNDWLLDALRRPGNSRFVEVDGVRLHYLVWGEDRTDKPLLVLVHGLRAHAHWWDAVAPSLADDYRVVVPDLSGMGDSDGRSNYVGAYSRDLIGVIECLNAGPVIVVGHSYGGSRVLQACGLRPELFQRLILVDTFVALDGEPLPEDPSRRTHRVYATMDQAVARFRLLPDQPAIDPRLLNHLALHSLRAIEGGFVWKFDQNLPPVMLREGNIGALLPGLSVPVDYVYGERSALIDVGRARRIVDRFGQGRRPIIIPNGHHHLMLDQPIALVRALRALLSTAP